MNRYESSNLKNTSPVLDDLKNEFNKMPRGVFDLSHRKVFDASEGWLIPFDYHELVPNSTLFLKYDIQLLSHNPTFRRLLSGSSIEVRVYKRNKNDSWEGWNNFITKGRTGKVTKNIPYVDFSRYSLNSPNYPNFFSLCPHTPACYLGFLPPVFYGVNESNFSNFVKSSYPQRFVQQKKSSSGFSLSDFMTGLCGSSIDSISKVNSSSAFKISALPFVLYNAIAFDYFDKNLIQNNTHWVKENENHQTILPYTIGRYENVEGQTVFVEKDFVTTSDYDDPIPDFKQQPADPNDSSSVPWLNALHRVPKRGDLFDTGSPFADLIRGDIPTLELFNADSVTSTLDFSKSVDTDANPWITQNILGLDLNNKLGVGNIYSVSGGYQIEGSKTMNEGLLDALNKAEISADVLNGLKFSMNQWRTLAALTVFAERMARTDGSYNELIKAQFGHNPRWHGHEPTFCGGFRQPIVFSEVVQQSASGDTPLGTTAGRSVSAQQNPEITVRTDDYCDVMAVLCIRPDEYYNQGVDKRVSRLSNAEQYFPILNNLPPDATLNKELYISGTNDTDEDIFNHVERFSYYKSLRNTVTGLMGLPSGVDGPGSISEYVKHRRFTSTPNFNIAFTMESEDLNMKSVYTSANESEYVISVACQEKLISPIPEITSPSDMGVSY